MSVGAFLVATVAASPAAFGRTPEALPEPAASPSIWVFVLWGATSAIGLGVLAKLRGFDLRRGPGEGAMTPIAALTLIVAGFGVWFAQVAGQALALNASEADPTTLRGLAIAALGGYLLGVGAALAVWSFLGEWRVRPVDALRGAGWFCAWFPLTTLVGFVALALAIGLGGAPESIAHATLRELAEPGAWRGDGALWWWLVVVSVVIGAPILEEVVYRGCLQTALRDALMDRAGSPTVRGRWVAIIATSLLFTAMHYGAADTYALPALFTLSLGFGIARERTGSVVAPIVMHGLFNLVNVGVGVWG